MAVLVVIFVLVVALSVCFALLKWNEIRYSRRGLPPGTMGWPLFGETTDFIKQGPDFMKKQRARFVSWGWFFFGSLLVFPFSDWMMSFFPHEVGFILCLFS